MRDAMVEQLSSAARGHGDGDETAELLRIIIGPLINEVMSLFQAVAVTRRFKELGRPLETAGTRLLAPQREGRAPAQWDLIRGMERGMLAIGFGRPTAYRMLVHLRWNGLSPKLLRGMDPYGDIVAIQRLPLVERHAQAESEFVRFVHPSKWFAPLHADCGVTNGGYDDRVITGAIEAFRSGFVAGNEELPLYLAEYLQTSMADGMRLSSMRLAAILRDPGQVPRRLWTGSGSGVWSRILRHATRRLGGTVTGHDHGNGTGHLVSSSSSISEFEACDEFMTFSEKQAQGLRTAASKGPQLTATVPKIVAAPPATGTSSNRGRRRVGARRLRATPVRRILFPSIYYPGETLSYFPLLPTPVAVDWQARVISRLRAWEYEVLLKPHPSSRYPTPSEFTERLGAKLLSERFERVLRFADVVLFDSPMSTTFGVALASDKPVVLMDYGRSAFTPEATVSLELRCRIVKAWFDEKNRLHIDWEELRRAIEGSRYLTDRTFVEEYRLS